MPRVPLLVDGVFAAVAGDTDFQSSSPGIVFHPASAIDETAQVQTDLRRRILRAFVGRGLLEGFVAKEMLGYQHSGFSVDAGVCIQAHDRAGLERLRKEGNGLVYRCAKRRSEPGSDKRGAKVDAQGAGLADDLRFRPPASQYLSPHKRPC